MILDLKNDVIKVRFSQIGFLPKPEFSHSPSTWIIPVQGHATVKKNTPHNNMQYLSFNRYTLRWYAIIV